MKQTLPCAAVKLVLFFFVTYLATTATTVFGQYVPQYFNSVGERDKWVAGIHTLISEAERELKKSEATLERYERHSSKYPGNRAGQLDDVSNWTRIVAGDKKKLAKLRALLQNIPPVRVPETIRQDPEAGRPTYQPQPETAFPAQPSFEGGNSFPKSQFGGLTPRQERAEGVANLFLGAFNDMQERNRKWEDMQDAWRERERQWEREAANAATAAQYTPPPAFRVAVPDPEPYAPPSQLGGYVNGFLNEVAVNAVTFFTEPSTIGSIADDFLDTGKDAFQDAATSLLSPDRQTELRAIQHPFSFFARDLDTPKESFRSILDKDLQGQIDKFNDNEASGSWPSGSR